LGGTMQMVAAGVLVAVAGPFLDATITPMLGAIALCGLIALILSRMIPRQAATA
jgi:MFS transporter, DHA1 family, multidrug resistance protein